mgnify:CR=1 FL=1
MNNNLFKLIKLSSNTLTINYLLYQLLLKVQITYKRKKQSLSFTENNQVHIHISSV